ncbi:MAG: proton-conducting membrane transporter, partial [Phycisphaerales bacterium]|nr:proton-conducting membrane transporter [Phycisphaerales bacterium]
MTEAPSTYDHAAIEAVMERFEAFDETLRQPVVLLQAIQDELRYIPVEAMEYLAERTGISAAQLTSVATFYSHFRLRPMGRHTIGVCTGTACHVKGAPAVVDAFRRVLQIPDGDDTDPTGEFTVTEVACLGCCTLAVAVQIDSRVYGHVVTASAGSVLNDFRQRRDAGDEGLAALADGETEGEIRLGTGSCCKARGCEAVEIAVRRALQRTGRAVAIREVGCVGICDQTPLLEIVEPDGTSTTYLRVDPQDAEDLILRHFPPKGILRKARAAACRCLDKLLTDRGIDDINADSTHAHDVREAVLENFLSPQATVVTEHAGHLDPLDLGAYEATGGFDALRRIVAAGDRQAVIDAISASGLRGRGGGGFPTARKWQLAHDATGEKKYVVLNGDEGDPGAFMDRMLLESYPLRVLEGLAIAAHAIGADEAWLYIRHEYPLALERIRHAISLMEDAGLLGLGDRPLTMKIIEGAGAFVCGEETALLESIEGRRGTPRIRPPFPVEAGLWGKPTLVNNVETLANVSWILRNSPEAFAAMGTEKSPGSKVFSLAGKVNNGGLIEVEMGMTIRDIVEKLGGGVREGRTLKAVQIGGPSGGCIPASLADVPVDYEQLIDKGAMMGSGGLVVLDDTDCMVDIARYFLRFTQDQSCGKCSFCRIGTRRMLDLLDGLCQGRGRPEDLDTLETLAHRIKAGSLCGLGKTAPNPVLTTLRYFREDYL